MRTQSTLSFLLALLLLVTVPVGADERKFSWQTGSAFVALECDGETVWRFNYDTNASSKPFFHPLALPGGKPLTWQSPDDHVWHYGLWFSWKFLNGVNYWEENKETRKSDGVTSWRVLKVETRPDFSARLELELDYRPRNASESVLIERRQIEVQAPAADGSYAIDWRQDFTAGAAGVKFDRTPLPGEPGGQVYGGYAGLSLRFARELTNTQIQASSDVGGAKDNRYRFAAAAADYSGQIAGRELGVALLDHSANPRHPTRWYAIVNPNQPFAFVNAAWLQLQAYELPAREKFSLRYRIVVHPGRWNSTRLQTEHSQFAETTE
jgi:hypothetical protein